MCPALILILRIKFKCMGNCYLHMNHLSGICRDVPVIDGNMVSHKDLRLFVNLVSAWEILRAWKNQLMSPGIYMHTIILVIFLF